MASAYSSPRHDRVRGALGASFLTIAYFAFDPIESAIHGPIAKALGLQIISCGELNLFGYGGLMLVRLALETAVVAGVLTILRRPWSGFPLIGPRMAPLTFTGLAIGFMVMAGAILAIIAGGSATVTTPTQNTALSTMFGAGWLAFDYIGAAGEELYGRVAILLVAQSLVGWRGAIAISGAIFSVVHIGSPGADWIWLIRLCVQGMLLSYAVYRTGSVWWSVGYHTGWNWASAPLFGAAGSGFVDQGHLFDFNPIGSTWITGGTVGPEGSIYAFAAMLCAFGLLMAFTPDRRHAERAADSGAAGRLPERP